MDSRDPLNSCVSSIFRWEIWGDISCFMKSIFIDVFSLQKYITKTTIIFESINVHLLWFLEMKKGSQKSIIANWSHEFCKYVIIYFVIYNLPLNSRNKDNNNQKNYNQLIVFDSLTFHLFASMRRVWSIQTTKSNVQSSRHWIIEPCAINWLYVNSMCA